MSVYPINKAGRNSWQTVIFLLAASKSSDLTDDVNGYNNDVSKLWGSD